MSRTQEMIFNEAQRAGITAAKAQNGKLGVEGLRGFDCGFAWVIVRPARGHFVAWCKANGRGHKGYEPGWHFWYSEFDNTGTQSVSVHVAAAEAFAAVLRKHGLDAAVESRLD